MVYLPATLKGDRQLVEKLQSSKNAPAVEKVLDFAQGLPLALRNLACVVASNEGMNITQMATQLSSREWMEQLREDLKLSQEEGVLRDVSENLFASLRLSTESLTSVARAALWSLSVFPKDFSKEAAGKLINVARGYENERALVAAREGLVSGRNTINSDAAAASSTAPATNGASSSVAGAPSAQHRSIQPLSVLTQAALLETTLDNDGSVQRYTLHPVVRQYAAWELRSKRGRQQEDERGKSEELS